MRQLRRYQKGGRMDTQSTRIEADLMPRLTQAAKDRGISRQELVNKILRAWVDKWAPEVKENEGGTEQ